MTEPTVNAKPRSRKKEKSKPSQEELSKRIQAAVDALLELNGYVELCDAMALYFQTKRAREAIALPAST